MKKLFGLKRTISFAAAAVITIGAAGSSFNYSLASADSDSEYFYEGSDSTVPADAVESSSQADTATAGQTDSTADNSGSSAGFDLTEYATKLRAIAQQQAKLDDEIFIVAPLPLGVISSKKPIA